MSSSQRDLLRRCREVGIRLGLAERGWDWQTLSPDERRLIGEEVSGEFVFAPTWYESRRILDRHPELLSDQIDQLYSHLIETARGKGNDELAQMYGEHRDLLRRCRDVGVQKAFDEKKKL
jgi:hypothetical protein